MFGVLYTFGGKLVHLLCDFFAATPTLQKSWDKSIRSVLGDVFMLGELHKRWIAFPLIHLQTYSPKCGCFRLSTANIRSMIQGLGGANYLIHMNGLKRMIELKGGWHAVSSIELLGEILAM